MKILFLKEQRTESGIEGVGINLLYCCIELDKRGVDYLVLYNAQDELYKAMLSKNINVLYLPFSSKSLKNIFHKKVSILMYRRKILNIVNDYNITHIHVHNAYLLDFVSKRWSIPITAHHHSAFNQNKLLKLFYFELIFKPKLFLKRIYEKTVVFNYKKADKVIAVSNAAKNTLQSKYGVPSKKIDLVYNGICDIKTKNFVNVRKKHAIMNSDHVVLSVGRITKAKGVEDFCKVAKILHNKNSVKFVFVGPYNCSEYANKIFNKYSKYVKFVGLTNDIYDYYKSSNTLLFLSHREACSNVIIESMSFKLPVIGWEVAGVSELVKNDYNGFLSKFGNINCICEKLELLITNKFIYDKLSINAFNERGKYTIKRNTDLLLNVFNNVNCSTE